MAAKYGFQLQQARSSKDGFRKAMKIPIGVKMSSKASF